MGISAKITVNEYTQLAGHKQGVYAIIHLRGGEILSSGGDGSVVRWNPLNKDPKGVLFAQLPEPVFCLLEHLDGSIWAGTQAGNLFVLERGQKPRVLNFEKKGIYFLTPDFLGNVWLGFGDGYLIMLNRELHIIRQVEISDKSLRCMKPMVQNLSKSDTDRFFLGSSDGILRKLQADGDVLQCVNANSPSIFAICYLDDVMLITGGRDAQLQGFDANLNPIIDPIKAHLYTIHAIEYNNDGLIATGSMDSTIKLWDKDLHLLKVIDRSKLPTAHRHSVNTLLWLSPEILVSAGDDSIIRVWQLETTQL